MINGKYGYVELLVRYRGLKMPKISIIDLKEEIRRKKNDEFFSDNLIMKININFSEFKKIHSKKKHQILFKSKKCSDYYKVENLFRFLLAEKK